MPATNIWIMLVITIVVSPISWFIFDEYGIKYYFMRKILTKRWLYNTVTYSLLLINLSLLILACLFPSWLIYILGGIWLGTVGELILSNPPRKVDWFSYKQAYDIYVTHADLWEKNLKKAKEKRIKIKSNRKRK